MGANGGGEVGVVVVLIAVAARGEPALLGDGLGAIELRFLRRILFAIFGENELLRGAVEAADRRAGVGLLRQARV